MARVYQSTASIPVILIRALPVTYSSLDCSTHERHTVSNTTVFQESTKAAHEAFEEFTPTNRDPVPREDYRGAVGCPDDVVQLLAEFEDAGLETSILKEPNNDRQTLELFVDEVLSEM